MSSYLQSTNLFEKEVERYSDTFTSQSIHSEEEEEEDTLSIAISAFIKKNVDTLEKLVGERRSGIVCPAYSQSSREHSIIRGVLDLAKFLFQSSEVSKMNKIYSAYDEVLKTVSGACDSCSHFFQYLDQNITINGFLDNSPKMMNLLSTTGEIMRKVNEWSLRMLKLCETSGLTNECEGVSNFWISTHDEQDFEGKQFLWTSDFQKLMQTWTILKYNVAEICFRLLFGIHSGLITSSPIIDVNSLRSFRELEDKMTENWKCFYREILKTPESNLEMSMNAQKKFCHKERQLLACRDAFQSVEELATVISTIQENVDNNGGNQPNLTTNVESALIKLNTKIQVLVGTLNLSKQKAACPPLRLSETLVQVEAPTDIPLEISDISLLFTNEPVECAEEDNFELIGDQVFFSTGHEQEQDASSARVDQSSLENNYYNLGFKNVMGELVEKLGGIKAEMKERERTALKKRLGEDFESSDDEEEGEIEENVPEPTRLFDQGDFSALNRQSFASELSNALAVVKSSDRKEEEFFIVEPEHFGDS